LKKQRENRGYLRVISLQLTLEVGIKLVKLVKVFENVEVI